MAKGALQRTLAFFLRHLTGLTVISLAVLLLAAPLHLRNPFILSILNLIGLFVIVVLGLNLFTG